MASKPTRQGEVHNRLLQSQIQPAVAQFGVYPGSFNPPTIAHLAIAEAARAEHGLDRVDLVISREALDKEHVSVPSLEERLAVVQDSIAELNWLGVVLTDDQLLVDIASGYDVLIMGADKWAQIQQLRFYESEEHRRQSIDALPTLAIAARPPFDGIAPDALLVVDEAMVDVSSSGARSGRLDWMTPAAQSWAAKHGGWPS